MKKMPVLLTITLASSLIVAYAQKLQRLPLQKRKIELKTPASWTKRLVKIDPQTKKEIYYDPKPRIELSNAKTGKYNLKWISHDGKEKVILYQRPDCVDVIVSAVTTRSSAGIYSGFRLNE